MVLAQGNGWWHVSIDGYIGFMDSSFLTLGLHTAQDIAARNGGGAGGGSYAVVNNPKSSQALNLRQYASTASVVEAKLYNGHPALGGRAGNRMVGGDGQEYRHVRLRHDPLPEAVQSCPAVPPGGWCIRQAAAM